MQAGREIKFQVWDQDAKKMRTWEDINKVDQEGILCFLDMLEEDQYIPRQFTGLRDKNGKEIYEGDILETRDDDGWFHLRVIYDEECARYLFVTDDDFYAPDELDLDEILVIGNIYENPELLFG
jgi:uncharacterized phage protein (TIGR01671 family)